MSTKITPQHIDNIHAEATAVEMPAGIKSVKSLDLSKFPALYKQTIRPILLSVTSLLKLFRRGDAANAISTTVAYLDIVTGAVGE